MSDAFSRILDGELGGVEIKGDPVFVEYSFREEGRGMGLSLLHWVELNSDSKMGKWFRGDKLPENLVDDSADSINVVVKHYQNYTRRDSFAGITSS
ncbi:MAG: hypothetical protein ABIE03_00965 [Patescibacteria group bacterium]|nr:hypothetical protein [Patescibacteria group bacterium]